MWSLWIMERACGLSAISCVDEVWGDELSLQVWIHLIEVRVILEGKRGRQRKARAPFHVLQIVGSLLNSEKWRRRSEMWIKVIWQTWSSDRWWASKHPLLYLKYLGFLQNQVCSLASLACTILGRKVLPCKMPRRSTVPKCIILGKKTLP